MNKQILKLAVKAGMYVDLNGTPWPRAMSAEDCEAAYKKFAELIVRECGVALSPMLRDMVSRGQAYDLIKQHFGVTE
jgi:hypothetical protein